jgi:putative zinc finger/helix-turn-helix YgiT family protein
MEKKATIPCAVCGGEARLVSEEREVRVGRRAVRVGDEFYRCLACGEELYLPGMMDAVLRRAAERIRAEDGLLAPEQVKSIRTKLGLTQPDFERLLGVGKNTCVRWERGTVPQSAATDSLLRLVDRFPENAEFLAELHGVELRGRAAWPERTASPPSPADCPHPPHLP